MLNNHKEVASLQRMTVNELRERYREVFGEESRSRNKQFLWKRVAWRMQALEQGGLSERARKRAMELAKDAEIRIRPPRDAFRNQGSPDPQRTEIRSYLPSHDRRIPLPGTVLAREYRGETIRVTVLEKGFEWDGQVYRSLTAIANAVTGSR
jgi:hypothetical protein